jgi:hypothetical protein
MIHVWTLIGTLCTGFMPPQGETGCHELISYMKFKTPELCERYNASRPEGVIKLRCVEELVDK